MKPTRVAAVREVDEETSIDVKLDQLPNLTIWPRETKKYLTQQIVSCNLE